MTPKFNANVDSKSLIVATASVYSGVGRYAKLLYDLGLANSLVLYRKSSSDNNGGFENVVKPDRGGYSKNTLLSLAFHTNWSKHVKRFDWVHVTTPDFFNLVRYNENMVGTVHDLFTMESIITRKAYSLRYRIFIKYNLEFLYRLKGVIAISNVTKKELDIMFPGLEIQVIHNWEDDTFKSRSREYCREILALPKDKKLILQVSSTEPRKNLDFVSRIMKGLGTQYILVRIGAHYQNLDELRPSKVITFQNVDDDIYPLFFNACDVFITTSVAEGFNRPLVQAIKSNCQIVASNTEVHREIMKGKGVLLEVDDPNQWIEKIKDICNGSLNTMSVSTQYELSEYYSKKRATEEIRSFYTKVLDNY